MPAPKRQAKPVLLLAQVGRPARLTDRECAQGVLGCALCRLTGALRLGIEEAPLVGIQDGSRGFGHDQPFTTTVSVSPTE